MSSSAQHALVSICIPAHCAEKYISQCLDALLAQTHQPIEIIVVNDGSTDRTPQMLKTYATKGINTIETTKGGASRARNLAFKAAKGDLIVFFDADDYVEKHFVETQVKMLKAQQDAVVLADWGRFYHDDLETFNLQKSPIENFSFYQWINKYWKEGNPMTNPGRALIPRKLVEQAGLWDESLSLDDDFEFFTRIFKSSKQIIFNQQAALYYRSGNSSLSNAKHYQSRYSSYLSTVKSVNLALATFPGDGLIRQSCANILQSFVYANYPNDPELIQNVAQMIKDLGGSTLEFPAGGYTKLLKNLVGWKATKKLKSMMQRNGQV